MGELGPEIISCTTWQTIIGMKCVCGGGDLKADVTQDSLSRKNATEVNLDGNEGIF